MRHEVARDKGRCMNTPASTVDKTEPVSITWRIAVLLSVINLIYFCNHRTENTKKYC